MIATPCRKCQRPIVWTRDRSGFRFPVDAAPVSTGRFDVFARGRDLVSREIRPDERFDGPRFASHFLTCPEGSESKRERQSRP